MAKIVGVFNTAHSPFCYLPPDGWDLVRQRRSLRADVPHDDLATNTAKAERVQQAFATLRRRLAAARPDVLVILGDDQREAFDFSNFPAFAVYVGAEFHGHEFDPRPPDARKGDEHVRRVKGQPELGVEVLRGLMERGFDPAFSMHVPREEVGLGHAFMLPSQSLAGFSLPVLPVLLNCYYAPQPTAMRCFEFGRALGAAIAASPLDLRVAVVGSGGLWHTPGAPDAYLDEDFDRKLLARMQVGDARGMAEAFDTYPVPPGDASQDTSRPDRHATGMPGAPGPQGGTRETCNWIAATATVAGQPIELIDYVPIYASPIGAGFACWTAA